MRVVDVYSDAVLRQGPERDVDNARDTWPADDACDWSATRTVLLWRQTGQQSLLQQSVTPSIYSPFLHLLTVRGSSWSFESSANAYKRGAVSLEAGLHVCLSVLHCVPKTGSRDIFKQLQRIWANINIFDIENRQWIVSRTGLWDWIKQSTMVRLFSQLWRR